MGGGLPVAAAVVAAILGWALHWWVDRGDRQDLEAKLSEARARKAELAGLLHQRDGEIRGLRYRVDRAAIRQPAPARYQLLDEQQLAASPAAPEPNRRAYPDPKLTRTEATAVIPRHAEVT